MKEALIKFIEWISLSFSGSKEVSARRLTAFAITNVYIFGRIRFIATVTDFQYLLYGSILDSLFILLLFGIVTMQQISELKNGAKND